MIIAIIAGFGELPVLAAKNIKDSGHKLIVIKLQGLASDKINEFADKAYEIGIGQPGLLLKTLANEKVTEVLFLGKVFKTALYENFKFDLVALKILTRLRNRKDDTIMLAIVEEIENKGFKVISQAQFLQNVIAHKGVYGSIKPNPEQSEDIKFGCEVAKAIGELDIGQTVVVKEKAVMAVEAIEGTDEAIKRGCLLTKKGGAVIVKTAKPNQDLRFDIPTIGPNTLLNIANYNGKVLAIEAESSFIIDLDECLKIAETHSIVFVGF